MGLFSFLDPGQGAINQATSGLSNYANTMGGIYSQYGAPAMQAMYQQYINPQNTPSQVAATNDFNTQTQANTRNAAGQLQQNLVGRGLGGSSITGNALSSLYGNSVNTMAQYQQNNNAQNQQRSQNALASLLGYGMNAENSLPGAYGQMNQLGQQQNQQAQAGLGGLGSFLMSPAPTGGFGATNLGSWL
jgi:hypothetical protein